MFISAGGVVKRSIEVYRANFASLMRYVGLVFGLGLLAVVVLVVGLFALVGLQAPSAGDLMGIFSMLSGSLLVFLIIWAIVFFFLSLWVEIAFMRTVSRAVLGQPKLSIAEEWKQSRPLIARTLGTSIVIGFIVTLPFLLGIFGWMYTRLAPSLGAQSGALGLVFTLLSIYGFFHMIYFSVRFCFSTLGVVVDGYGIKESLQKSSALVKGRWWGILWRMFVVMLALIVPYYILLFLGGIKGFVGIFFSLATFAYYILCLIPLAMIPSQVIYTSAKESSPEKTPAQ
jgi:hypothetical protein